MYSCSSVLEDKWRGMLQDKASINHVLFSICFNYLKIIYNNRLVIFIKNCLKTDVLKFRVDHLLCMYSVAHP